jgi:hypothetical protein
VCVGDGGCGGGSAKGDKEKGPCSVTGVRAGPDRMIGMPLTGRIGEPRASLGGVAWLGSKKAWESR